MPQLIDNHGRPISYVRLAVTDRCNLRCFYCMPAEGIDYVPRKELLSYEEMLRLLEIMAPMGIRKVRITGGEPFLRKDLTGFIARINQIEGIEAINITTNGVLTQAFIPTFKEIGIKSVNLSLDTVDRERFKMITRRDELHKVLDCLDALVAAGIPTKINAVVMNGKNTDDIIPLAHLSKERPISVRYIEEMPFNGGGDHDQKLPWNHKKILATLQTAFPGLEKTQDEAHSTSFNYMIPGHLGQVGIIPAFSRTFCGSCNRIRITPTGGLKTCLYDGGVLSLRDLMRATNDDEVIKNKLIEVIGKRAKDGFEAERMRKHQKPSESMATIGG